MESKGDILSQLTLFGTDAQNGIVPFTRHTVIPVTDTMKFIAAMVVETMTPDEFKAAMDAVFDED